MGLNGAAVIAASFNFALTRGFGISGWILWDVTRGSPASRGNPGLSDGTPSAFPKTQPYVKELRGGAGRSW